MNNDELKNQIQLHRKNLQALNLRIGKLLQDCDKAMTAAIPSALAEELMQSCINLGNDEFLGAKAKPAVNAIHKACYKNAKFAREETRKAEEQSLTALMPACYRPKSKKAVEPNKDDEII